jgi:hypothetical protein
MAQNITVGTKVDIIPFRESCVAFAALGQGPNEPTDYAGGLISLRIKKALKDIY